MSVRRWWWMMVLGTLLGCWLATLSYAGAPSRDNTYVAGTTIEPNDVRDNEDNIYTYLQSGVDTYANNSIPTAAIQNNAITTSKILDGTITTADLAFTISPGNVLPAGAVFFMITGSCPTWTTDVSATYANMFLRVNATQGTTGGDTTHTHTAGSYTGPSHTHSVPFSGWDSAGSDTDTSKIAQGKAGEAYVRATVTNTTGSGGGGAITGTSASGSSLPSFVTMKLCKVN